MMGLTESARHLPPLGTEEALRPIVRRVMTCDPEPPPETSPRASEAPRPRHGRDRERHRDAVVRLRSILEEQTAIEWRGVCAI
jgi:hypothetical protein